MLDVVQLFIDILGRITNVVDLRDALDAVVKEIGFDYFALMEHVDLARHASGEILFLTTYPSAWVDFYIAKQIVSNDPVLLASHRTSNGFRWSAVSDFIPISAAHRAIRERTIKAGIIDGFTVPAHIPGTAHGSCNFALGSGRILAPTNYHAAQLVGSFAFEAGRRIVHNGDRTAMPTKLTPRMIDCVFLAACGKTDWEAGTILGIAEDTVTEYLDEARRRYDVGHRSQLLMRALFDGHLAISDVIR